MMPKKLKLGLAVLVMGAASVAVTAEPAHAAYNCTSGFNTTGAYSKCLSPANSWYHTNVLCQNIFTLASRTVKGNWVNTNSSDPSTVQGCGNWDEQYYGSPWASTN